MYSFEPNEEQKMLIDVAKRYAETDLRPAAHEAEEEGIFDPKLIEKGWELGILQASIPDTYGGFGDRSLLTSVLALEELAVGDMAGALSILAPSLFVTPILIAGTEEQKTNWIPPVIEAEWKAYTAAMIEYAYDYDPNELKTTATLDGDSYLLKGEKRFVPFADQAEAIIVYANLDGKTQGFIVPKGLEGLEVGEREATLGTNGLQTFSLVLDNVKVPKANRLGGEAGHDFAPILAAAQTSLAAVAVGVARASFEYARDYSKERFVLGSFIAQKQSIAFMIAEMAAEVEAIRLLTWEAAYMLDKGEETAAHSAYLALMGAIDMAMMVTDRGVQILGGHGYIREHPVELWFRNGRGIASLTGLVMG
ncbi:MAG: acyl-CoA dehydrogenase [Chloroflexi bacterium]|jgi:acyl-CoA dehydrogenase|nr:acyl-CoA dehydrogenase [Chloroflexota bacterium]MBT3668927.1 acyl-CoA dehydrogenase [Chloroflexota bacterium]MBT4305346.1 acyl-CoA dehydrogenase [Chloroflexota bacterium]MBT4532492.1 acyl-CoA dehydrogenase [Chloroflexota bacterium]MBT4683153.1 acyl-CoA dehydrogenase [Chloroflexota bacterium]